MQGRLDICTWWGLQRGFRIILRTNEQKACNILLMHIVQGVSAPELWRLHCSHCNDVFILRLSVHLWTEHSAHHKHLPWCPLIVLPLHRGRKNHHG